MPPISMPPRIDWISTAIMAPLGTISQQREYRIGLAKNLFDQLPGRHFPQKRSPLAGPERKQAGIARLCSGGPDLARERSLDREGRHPRPGHLAREPVGKPASGAAGEGASDHGAVVFRLPQRSPVRSAGARLGATQERSAQGDGARSERQRGGEPAAV